MSWRRRLLPEYAIKHKVLLWQAVKEIQPGHTMAKQHLVEVYKQDCKALDNWLNSDELDKESATYQRVEWTRDRIDETLESLVRVEWRMGNWFKTDFPKEGEEGYSYEYKSCYKKE